MKFIGVASGEQARRGWWRVVLKRDLFDLGFFVSNPLDTWADRVEKWRVAVDAGDAKIPAVTSTASVTTDAGLGSPRAVVDVHILGAEAGESVGVVANRLDALTARIDILSVEVVNNSDPIARDAALKLAEEESDPLGLKGLLGILETGVKLVVILAVVYVVVLAVKESRK